MSSKSRVVHVSSPLVREPSRRSVGGDDVLTRSSATISSPTSTSTQTLVAYALLILDGSAFSQRSRPLYAPVRASGREPKCQPYADAGRSKSPAMDGTDIGPSLS